MTNPPSIAPQDSLEARLRAVEPHRRTSPGQACSNWYRNPDGPEAAYTLKVLGEALERIAGGRVVCADGSTRPLTVHRMSLIARDALVKVGFER